MTNIDDLVASGRRLGALRVQQLGMSTRLGAAIVLRQAYEAVVDEYWRRVAPPLEHTNHRNQLTALRAYAGDEAADTAAYLWAVLSDACHYDAYDLPPTTREIDHLAEMIHDLAAALRDQ